MSNAPSFRRQFEPFSIGKWLRFLAQADIYLPTGKRFVRGQLSTMLAHGSDVLIA